MSDDLKSANFIEGGPGKPFKKDTIKQISASTAGASSGDFHEYRNLRRIEQDRLAEMDRLTEKEKLDKEYEDRIAIQKAKELVKSAKNKNKRLRRKKNREQAKKKQKLNNGTSLDIKESKNKEDNEEKDNKEDKKS